MTIRYKVDKWIKQQKYRFKAGLHGQILGSMEKPWKIHRQPMYSKQYAPCMRPTFSILMKNPSFLRGVYVFSMEFHDFSLGNPWYISVRGYTLNNKNTNSKLDCMDKFWANQKNRT